MSAVFGIWGLLCVASIWAFLAGTFVGVFAVAFSLIALADRPSRHVRRVAFVGLASGGLALAGSAVLGVLWLMGA